MPIDSNFDRIFGLFDKIIIFLRRPQVQVQLLVLIALIGVSIIVTRLIWALLGEPLNRWVSRRKSRRWRGILGFVVALVRAITFPVLALILTQAARQYLLQRGIITGLLDKTEAIFWVILVFQIGVTILYAMFDDEMVRKYHRRIFIPLLCVFIFLGVLSTLTSLGGLGDTVLTRIGEHPISIGLIFIATVGLYFWTGGAQVMEDLTYDFSVKHTRLDPGSTKAGLTLLRYILVALGVAFVLSQFDLNAATVAAITGGLSVGIGFGLREILSNFISGIFLLIERSLQPGDVLEVEGQMSVVENVQIRATLVRTLNNEELVIPNQTFFTSSFKTYTGQDKTVRIPIILRTDCIIEPNHVVQVLTDAALSHPDVLDDPAPSVFLLEYGDNVATFKLHVWLDSPVLGPKVTSDIKFAAWDAFKENGIALPFPEVELHFPPQVSLAMARAPKQAPQPIAAD